MQSNYNYSNQSRRPVLRNIAVVKSNRKSPRLNFNILRIESKRFIEDVKVLKAYIKKQPSNPPVSSL